MNCIICGKELSEDAKFCSGCGSVIQGLLEEKNCDACGAKVLYTDRFCSSCGKSFLEQNKSDFEEYEEIEKRMTKNMIIGLVIVAVFVLIFLLITSDTSALCSNGCGNPADPKCMADMCDKCCHYWTGLNGCYAAHG